MATPIGQKLARQAWEVAERQHGVISRAQLLELGFTKSAIRHRLADGRLHPLRSGVYAVGRPAVDRKGEWMAAVLACGEGAILSHASAGALWGVIHDKPLIDVTVPESRHPRQAGVRTHRASKLAPPDVATRDGIHVTSPIRTLMDLATCCSSKRHEAAVNAADKLDLVDPERLRSAIEGRAGERGVAVLRKLLDRRTFVLTDSELERRFLPIARAAGLPKPETRRVVNGFRVDFLWRDLGLVVETDGLRYHRTPSQQARDRTRDNAHAASGLTTLRFTHAQVRYESDGVRRTLLAVARRLGHRSSD
jgi:very-short-patch-repair endonuclease